MKTQLKWMVVGGIVAAGAGVLLGAAAFQPGLEPSAGPVSDTSPSLAELDAKLDAIMLASSDNTQPNLVVSRVVTVPNGSADVFVAGSGEIVRLVSIILPNGDIEVRDASGTVVNSLRAGSVNAGSGFSGFAQYDLNVDVELPLSIVRRSSNFTPEVTVLYRMLD